ncbi:hypothetical protein SELMODRAFT_416861 [Selaginella moellendorffii]|nr:uncharacterized protein LOC9638496 [Selaginella moellendorffii]XP_002994692.1 uncharacterized protein LOC9652898 [Selaginella moellendorffii]EFJ04242.1 hypothetical protein SELMODRAFT_432595 [Selaginella moellendorffii]EFJ21952.1 hypothetical protein SELMODRAFT_416861 [Selaginella moellendorffii]|eukprot:XP_002976842.1 uncharacterized protein LOC9638496 [Selaginella moellendorffii]
MNTLFQRLLAVPLTPSRLQLPHCRVAPSTLTGGRCGFRWGTVRCAGAAPYPPKTKFRKMHKGRCEGILGDGSKLAFGTFGIKVLHSGKITYQTIEAARRVISRRIKGSGRMWIRVIANYPVTSKPLATRMGKGKGNVSGYVARCKAGKILFEVDGLAPVAAKEALIQAGHKIGLRTKIVEWS